MDLYKKKQFLEFSDYQDFKSGFEEHDFRTKFSSWSTKSFLEEIKPVVSEENEFDYAKYQRHKGHFEFCGVSSF